MNPILSNFCCCLPFPTHTMYEQLINLSDYFQFQECAMKTFMILHMLFLLIWITLPSLFAWPIPSHSLDFSLDVASFGKLP